jgi:hypothetical protein
MAGFFKKMEDGEHGNLVEEDVQEEAPVGCSFSDRGFLTWYEEQPAE